MKAIDLIFRETLTAGQFEMKSHVLVFIDEAGNEYSDTFSEVRHNGRFEEYQYNGMGYEHMQDLNEKWKDVKKRCASAKVLIFNGIDCTAQIHTLFSKL